jgi:hypothetical protein
VKSPATNSQQHLRNILGKSDPGLQRVGHRI